MGLAREDAIALMGESYGGYGVLSLLTQTDRFKAAITIASPSNLFSIYSSMDDTGASVWIGWAEQSQGRMGGTPWQYRDKYIENSPFFFADRINTPVLMAHGGGDEVSVYDARQMFVALRRLGKTATYVEYQGARHMPQEWPHEDQLDLWNKMIEWFDHYLKPQ